MTGFLPGPGWMSTPPHNISISAHDQHQLSDELETVQNVKLFHPDSLKLEKSKATFSHLNVSLQRDQMEGLQQVETGSDPVQLLHDGS